MNFLYTILQAFDIWGQRNFSHIDPVNYKILLKDRKQVTIEDAVFRKEDYFIPANLQNNLSFWEHKVLVDHPHKNTILNWLTGVKIEEFPNSFTSTTFQQQEVHSYYPQPREFENYVPPEFRSFMNEQVQDWGF